MNTTENEALKAKVNKLFNEGCFKNIIKKDEANNILEETISLLDDGIISRKEAKAIYKKIDKLQRFKEFILRTTQRNMKRLDGRINGDFYSIL